MEPPLFIGNLHKGREKRSITVRIVRKWTYVENQGQGDPLYVGLIFADVHGGSIYAEIPAQLIPTKEILMALGAVYQIKKFVVKGARETFKVVDNPLMIELSQYTVIEAVPNPPNGIPEIVYDTTPFPAIQPPNGPLIKYTDAIGYLSKYSAVDSFVPKNRERVVVLRELYLRDLNNNELKVTIWGDHATNFNIDQIYDENLGNIIVCLVVGCTPRRNIKNYNEVILTGSSPFAYYLNPQIMEAQEYYTRFKDEPVFIERPPREEVLPPIRTEGTPLQLKLLADLNAITDPFNFQDGAYKCIVTVTSIVQTTRWWYMACKPCKKKALQQANGSYKCPICNGSNTAARYLLSFMAKDETAEARFFAHDNEARILIGRDCDSVMSTVGSSEMIPQQLLNIVNKKYVFSIDLDDGHVRQYVVKAVLAKPPRRPAPQIEESAAESSGTRSENRAIAGREQPLQIMPSAHSDSTIAGSGILSPSTAALQEIAPPAHEREETSDAADPTKIHSLVNTTPSQGSPIIHPGVHSQIKEANPTSSVRRSLTFENIAAKDNLGFMDSDSNFAETLSDEDQTPAAGSSETPNKKRKVTNTRQSAKQKNGK